MWHDVTYVARVQKLPEADLVDFAIARDKKYSIIIEQGIARISTWHVDALIADFERFQAEEEFLKELFETKGFTTPAEEHSVLAAEDAQILAAAEAMKPFDAGCEYDGKVVA